MNIKILKLQAINLLETNPEQNIFLLNVNDLLFLKKQNNLIVLDLDLGLEDQAKRFEENYQGGKCNQRMNPYPGLSQIPHEFPNFIRIYPYSPHRNPHEFLSRQ